MKCNLIIIWIGVSVFHCFNLTGQDEELIVSRSDKWQYYASEKEPDKNWKKFDYSMKKAENSGWKTGESGFGYGDNDDTTVIKMKDKFLKVYIRRPFKIEDPENIDHLILMIRYDDAFILYINGQRVLASDNIGESSKGVRLKKRHEAQNDSEKFTKFRLPMIKLNKGLNFIAIVGFNFKLNSSDFSLDPYLLAVMKK